MSVSHAIASRARTSGSMVSVTGAGRARVRHPSRCPAVGPDAPAACRARCPCGYAGHPARTARRSSPRALVGTLLALIAAALTSTVALEGPRGLQRLAGLDDSAPLSAPAAGAPAVAPVAPPVSVSFVQAAASGSTIESARYASAALHERDLSSSTLPPGFSYGGQRYPVLYLLHGNAQHASAFLELG